jgi:parallel beta-helix repeat protein
VDADARVASCYYGLAVTASNSTFKGLTVNGFTGTGPFGTGGGVLFGGPGGANTLTNSLIGTDKFASSARPNAVAGVLVYDSAGNTIGPGNTISGNSGSGVIVAGPAGGNVILSSAIGTNGCCSYAVPNTDNGVLISGSPNNQVRGNTISGNAGTGVRIFSASDNHIFLNGIGSDAAGNYAIPNTRGVEIDGSLGPATGNRIGLPPLGGNAIVGNGSYGVYIHGPQASGNFLHQSSVGSYFHGSVPTAIPNSSHGVYISDGAHDNEIGGSHPGVDGADVSNNGEAGIALDGAGTGNRVGATTTHDNVTLGIDIAPLCVLPTACSLANGVTPFYSPSTKAGLTSALYCPSNCFAGSPPGNLLEITGYIQNGPASESLGVGLFKNTGCDPSGYGEAQSGIFGAGISFHAPGLATDAAGDMSTSGSVANIGASIVGQYITTNVTTTDGTSSEYGNCIAVELDTDGDGIQDILDVGPPPTYVDQSNVYSNHVDSRQLGGTGYADIVDRSDCYVTVAILPNPADGGVWGAICPLRPVPAPPGYQPPSNPLVTYCGTGTLVLGDGESVRGNCGSTDIEVHHGPVEERFGTITAVLNTGTITELVDLGGGSYQVTNDAPSTETISVGGLTVVPGQTVIVGDTDGDGLVGAVETNTGIFVSQGDTGTNPADNDTDDDQLEDGIEVLNYGTNPHAIDTELDGCSDKEEVGAAPAQGGKRDPIDANDFFDVPAPAGPATGADGKLIITLASTKNRAVSLQDVGVVLAYVGRISTNPAYAGDNNADGLADGAQLDRTPSTVSGELWHSGPPNGAISLQDVGVSLAQVGHSCVAAPN